MLKRLHIYILLTSLYGGITYAQVKPIRLLPDTIVVCAGDSFLVKFAEEQVSKSATFQWITDYAIIVHVKQLYVKKKGRYIVKINDANKILIDTTYVKIQDKPNFKIRDTLLCVGNIISLIPKNKQYKYTWNNTETSSTYKIDKPGNYFVKVNNKGCYYTDTFKVIQSNSLILPNFGKELLVCETEANKVLSVKASNDVQLYWNTGANSASINTNKEGIYWVKSISKNCGTKTDSVTVKYKNCDCDVFIPNSFTPNDDDKNDVFVPVFQCEYTYFNLTIVDRWGNTVYSSGSITGKWDGRFKGNLCPDDVYVYRLEAIQKNNDKKIVRNGHISLFR